MASDLAPGQLIADKYRVERVLGEGGMGYVVAAHHLKLDQRVALKFLKPDALKHPHVVQRFAREARAAAKIRGEHVARVIDVGDLPSGAPYIVMEYLEGEDLGQRLQQRGPLQVEEAVGYLLQACEALAEAHAAGIVHRDLKPPNLFLARTAGRIPIVKVLDFGISKALDESADGGRHLTSTSMIMGTPHYMSPEQLRSSRDVDPRSDIWALGVVLFELLTGQPPFDGENPTAVITSIIADDPRSLLELRADAPSGLWAVLLRCLAKSRGDRFANVLQLAKALAPFSAERARDSLARIESIVHPLHSIAPPPDTQVSLSATPETKVDPIPESSAMTSVEVSVPLPSTERVAISPGSSFGSQHTVRSADFPADALRAVPAETRANWDATLPAVPAASGRRRVGMWAAAGAVVVGLGGYALARGEALPLGTTSAAAPTPTPSGGRAESGAAPTALTAASTAVASAVPAALPGTSAAASTAVAPLAPPSAAVAPRTSVRSPKATKISAAPAPHETADKNSPAPAAAPAAPQGGSLRMGIK